MMDKINELRKEFGLNNETKMVVMLSISMNYMNRYVAMYTQVCFIDCTAGMLFEMLWKFYIIQIGIELSIWHAFTGNNWQKKQLFVMAVSTLSGTRSMLQEQKGHNQGQAVPQEILPFTWN
jgi:hypothetical protein